MILILPYGSYILIYIASVHVSDLHRLLEAHECTIACYSFGRVGRGGAPGRGTTFSCRNLQQAVFQCFQRCNATQVYTLLLMRSVADG